MGVRARLEAPPDPQSLLLWPSSHVALSMCCEGIGEVRSSGWGPALARGIVGCGIATTLKQEKDATTPPTEKDSPAHLMPAPRVLLRRATACSAIHIASRRVSELNRVLDRRESEARVDNVSVGRPSE